MSLANRRVDIDSKDQFGCTPLIQAASGAHEAVVRLLLSTGRVDVDLNDFGGSMPLSKAA
jgi:ankyrin repeat protein